MDEGVGGDDAAEEARLADRGVLVGAGDEALDLLERAARVARESLVLERRRDQRERRRGAERRDRHVAHDVVEDAGGLGLGRSLLGGGRRGLLGGRGSRRGLLGGRGRGLGIFRLCIRLCRRRRGALSLGSLCGSLGGGDALRLRVGLRLPERLGLGGLLRGRLLRGGGGGGLSLGESSLGVSLGVDGRPCGGPGGGLAGRLRGGGWGGCRLGLGDGRRGDALWCRVRLGRGGVERDARLFLDLLHRGGFPLGDGVAARGGAALGALLLELGHLGGDLLLGGERDLGDGRGDLCRARGGAYGEVRCGPERRQSRSMEDSSSRSGGSGTPAGGGRGVSDICAARTAGRAMAADASDATTARFTSATRASSALAAALTTRRVRVADLPRLRGFAVPARASRFPATTADIFSRLWKWRVGGCVCCPRAGRRARNTAAGRSPRRELTGGDARQQQPTASRRGRRFELRLVPAGSGRSRRVQSEP